MPTRTATRSCSVQANWEWVQGTSSGGGTKYVTKTGYSGSCTQQWAWDGAYWNSVGSPTLASQYNTYSYSDADGYSGTLSLTSWSGSANPPTYSGSYFDQRVSTTGSASCNYGGNVTKTVTYTYYWSNTGTSHNHPSSVAYNDGTYEGTLNYTSCTGSAPSPSSSGSYVGQTAATSGSGTASYSGEVTLIYVPPPADTTAPSVSASASFSGTGLNVSWSATDANGISTYKVYVSNSSQTSYGLKNNYTSASSATYYTDGANLSFQHGYFYNVKVEAYDPSNNVGTKVLQVQYLEPPPAAPSAPVVSGVTYKDATISWGSVTGATHYRVDIRKTVDSWSTNGTIYTGTSASYNGLQFNTNYEVRVTSLKSDGSGGYITGGTSTATSFKTDLPPDTTPPEIMITGTNGDNTLSISWTATDDYGVSNFDVFIDGTLKANVGSGTTSYTFTSDKNGNALVNGTTYLLTVKAWDSNTNSSSASQSVLYTYNALPTISIVSYDNTNKIRVSWQGSDAEGLRATNTYSLWISGPGDTNLTFKEYITEPTNNVTLSYIFESDRSGSPFVADKVYQVRVVVSDNKNKTNYDERFITFKKVKPTAFSWTNAKTQTGQYNLTANEWKLFISKINEYIVYKSSTLTPLAVPSYFTGETATTYIVPTDYSYNDARSYILTLGATTAPPPAVMTGDIITAYHLNQIVASLNTIP